MNLEEELKRLEAATSRELPSAPEQNLDAETAELREGWRVLKALEASGSSFDEGALIAKLQREMISPAAAAGTNGRGNGWMVVGVLGGALAASLLILVAIGSGWFGQQQPVAKPVKAITPGENKVAVEKTSGASQYDATTPSWDDSLDSQISVAAAQMQTMQKPALPLDASISTLNYQLQQMAQDLDDGAL